MIKYQCYVMEDVDLAGLELSIPGLRGKFWLRCIGCFYVLPTWIMYTLEPIQKKHRPQNLETIFGIFALPVWYFCTLLFCDIFNVFASSSVTEDPAIKEQEPPKKVSPIYFSQKRCRKPFLAKECFPLSQVSKWKVYKTSIRFINLAKVKQVIVIHHHHHQHNQDSTS